MSRSARCFVDTETDGVHDKRRPWETAIIRRDEAGERSIVITVKDPDLSLAQPKGLAVSRFYERHPQHRASTPPPIGGGVVEVFVPEAQAALLVLEWTRDAEMIGIVPSFDTECLGAMLRRHGLEPEWHYQPTDVAVKTEGWFSAAHHLTGAPLPIDTQNSEDISRAFGVEPPDKMLRHTAFGDADWVRRWWDQLAADRSIATGSESALSFFDVDRLRDVVDLVVDSPETATVEQVRFVAAELLARLGTPSRRYAGTGR